MKNKPLRFNKTMIAEILGVKKVELDHFIDDETSEAVKWKERRQKCFTDEDVYLIIKCFRRLASREDIIKMIYPGGF